MDTNPPTLFYLVIDGSNEQFMNKTTPPTPFLADEDAARDRLAIVNSHGRLRSGRRFHLMSVGEYHGKYGSAIDPEVQRISRKVKALEGRVLTLEGGDADESG